MPVKKCIECVKEFLLGPLLATQKLDVINQKQISLAITLPELDQIAVLDRVDELVNEEFAREVDYLHVFFQYFSGEFLWGSAAYRPSFPERCSMISANVAIV